MILLGEILAIAFILSLVIIFHEFGHLLVAKWRRLPVLEFSLGFGPPLWRRTMGGTLYSVRPILLGGYVRIAGLDPGDEHPQGFDKRSGFVRSAVLLAGPLMNIVLAACLFSVVGMVWGRVAGDTTEVQRVLPGLPADEAEMRPGDRVVAINGEPVTRFSSAPLDEPADHPSLVEWVREHPDEPLLFTLERAGRTVEVTVVPKATRDLRLDEETGRLVPITIGQIGIVPILIRERISPQRAVAEGVKGAVVLTKNIVHMLGLTLVGRAPAEVIGPVGITKLMREQLQLGWERFLSFSGTLSVIIAIVNLLPIPGLDGGRLLFIGVEGIIRRKLNRQVEAIVHTVGIVLVLVLVAGITIKEVLQMVNPP